MRPLLAIGLLALAASASAGTVAGSVSVTDKGGRPASDLQETVVYLEGARTKPKPVTASVAMRGKAFLPHVVVVPVGSSVAFPNQDPILHNAFSVSGENRFDLDLYKRPQSKSQTFQKPGVVRVYCNIHPQMSAIVLVADTPHYAKAAADGSFSIEGVPAGTYVLKAWHERGGEASQEVVVAEGGAVRAQLALDASAFKRAPHKNKYGKDYSAGGDKY
ncbi:MAG TPA: carboxypeptidase regulatory-like domain-containing protein [Vicinamibacteria bacterium]|nr:carboxypeptidase regulatory-like domain-containing protein [Vicinamibacteria bacterium]